jgi:hypothetical protein
VGVAVGSIVGVGSAVGTGVAVGVAVGNAVAVAIAVAVEMAVAVATGVGASVAIGDGDNAGTGWEAVDCATGAEFTHVSATLSLLSVALPAEPPGSRSRLDLAGGASPGVASTNALDASPQLSESRTAPPRTRRMRLPPVALKPPEYNPSAPAMKTPAEFASRR